MKKILAILAVIGLLGFASNVFALATTTSSITILPLQNNKYYLGTSTPSALQWLGIFTKAIQVGDLGGSGTRCVQTDNNGLLSKASAACGSGSGGGTGGGTWATTTSQTSSYFNYPLNATDIVGIGSTSGTSTAFVFFDPNINLANILGKASTTNLFVNGSSTLQAFTFTTATGTSATTTSFFSTTASTTNLFGSLINGFGLLTCNGTTGALSWAAGKFGCGTIAPPASAITNGAALTKTDDTNVTLTLGGSPSTALLAATSLTLGWTGTLADSRVADNLTISGGTVDNTIIGGTTAAAGTFTNLLVTGSSTLQKFTFTNATGSQATTTGFAATTICFTGDTCRTTWPTGGSSASSTLLGDNNGFTGLNTFSDIKALTRATITDATTSSIFISGNASTTKLFGSGLATCNGASSALIYTGSTGLFGCNTISAGSSASSTLLGDNNGFTGLNTFSDLKLVTRSTTTNATSTNEAITGFATIGTASTTNFFGSNLVSCNSASNAVTWNNGLFGCNSITAGASTIATSTATTTVWIDQNNTKSTPDGTIENPYTSISAAIKSYPATYMISTGTYVEGGCNLNFTATSTIQGGKSTILCFSGTPFGSGAGTVTFSKGITLYDTVLGTGNVNVIDTAASDEGQFTNFTVAGGNINLYGFDTFTGGALQGGSVYTGPNSLTAFTFLENNDFIGVAGTANFDTMDFNVSSVGAGTYGLTSTTTGYLQINGMSYENTAANGGGIYCKGNGATVSQPNAISSMNMVVGTTTNSGAINCGSTAIEAGPYSVVSSSNGASLFVSGTNPQPFDFLGINTEGTTTLALFGGHVGIATSSDATAMLNVQGISSSTGAIISGIKSSLLTTNSSGTVAAYAGASACGANNFVTTLSALGGTTCGSSTISGVALGGTLGALTATDATLTFSGSYTGAAAQTVGLNLATGNIWTAASSTFVGGVTLGKSTTSQATSTNFFTSIFNGVTASTSALTTQTLLALSSTTLQSFAFTNGTGSGLFSLGSTTPTWQFTVASTAPYMELDDTDGATNQKHFVTSFNSGIYRLATSSDTTFTSTSTSFLSLDTTQPFSALFGTTTATTGILGDWFSTASTSLRLDSNSTTKGGCIVMKDTDGVGYTYVTANNGVLTASQTSCL